MLLAAGIVLPLLGTAGLQACCLPALGLIALFTLLTAVLTSFRAGKLIFWGGIAASLLIWLALFGGMTVLTEAVKAILMEYSGYVTAALYAPEIMALLALIGALLAWALTRDDMGLLPAIPALLLTGIALWATDSEALTFLLTPGAAAVLLLAAGSSDAAAPMRRALPSPVALALLAGVVSLGGGVKLEPLYSAAAELRQRIEDYLFFTEPRNVFSLAAEGYYPQGPNQLGGTAEPSDRLVMIVETPRTVYLRGSIKNEYTGRAWYDTTGGRRYLWISPRWASERDAAFNLSLPSEVIRSGSSLLTEQRVSVRMADTSASTLFVPQRVRSLSTGADAVPYFNRGSELFTTRDLKAGDLYTVTAPLMTSGSVGLDTIINACAAVSDPAYAQIAASYTLLPEHLQDIVRELAADICKNAVTPYDKAFAIQNYLMRSYRYTLEVEPQPENIDFITNFLFNTQEGYCTYFASAMTVLCRIAGLPARYVEGYLAEPDANGVAYVTGRNGHAWTEVYFNGFGWLTFDATPLTSSNAVVQTALPPETIPEESEEPTSAPDDPASTPDPAQTPPAGNSDTETPTPDPAEDTSAQPTPTPAPQEAAAPENPAANASSAPTSWIWWLLLVLLLSAACALRILMTTPERLAARAKTPEDAYDVWVQAVYDALCLAGLRAAPSESPLAYAKRLDASGKLPVRMTPIGHQLSMVYYGKLIPRQSEIAPLHGAWKALLNRQKPFDRLRLTLLRAFVPLKYRSFLQR